METRQARFSNNDVQMKRIRLFSHGDTVRHGGGTQAQGDSRKLQLSVHSLNMYILYSITVVGVGG